jgi:hypothetical protein
MGHPASGNTAGRGDPDVLPRFTPLGRYCSIPQALTSARSFQHLSGANSSHSA